MGFPLMEVEYALRDRCTCLNRLHFIHCTLGRVPEPLDVLRTDPGAWREDVNMWES